MLFSYSIGFVYLFFLVAVFTDIASAINYCSYYPKQTYGYAFIFSLTGYLGIQVKQRLPNYSVKMGDLFRLFSASSDNLELSWQSLSQPSGRQLVLFSPSSSSPSPSHSIMFTGKILISTFVDIQGRNFYFPNFSGLLVLIGIYLSLYSKNKDSNSVAVFNNMFKKIKRLLFVPKFHTGKHSYNI